MNRLGLVIAAAVLMLAGSPAVAQKAGGYPSEPIHIVVPFPPGGGSDILARLIGEKISKDLGQPVVIDNKPGANSIIGAQYVAEAPADGYTLLIGSSGAMAVNAAVYDDLPYAPEKDFASISMLGSFPLVLVVGADSPFQTLQELIDYTKANPEKSNYAGASASFQLAAEIFKEKSGAPLQHVAYQGGVNAVRAVMAGEVLCTVLDPVSVGGKVASGELRALALTSADRFPLLSEIPTMAEAGVQGVEVTFWTGVFAPDGTPPEALTKLQAAIAAAVQVPEIAERMKSLGVMAVGSSSEELSRTMSTDIAQFRATAKANNIRAK